MDFELELNILPRMKQPSLATCLSGSRLAFTSVPHLRNSNRHAAYGHLREVPRMVLDAVGWTQGQGQPTGTEAGRGKEQVGLWSTQQEEHLSSSP